MNSRLIEIFIIVMGFCLMGLVIMDIYKTHERQACIKETIACGMTAEEVLKICR